MLTTPSVSASAESLALFRNFSTFGKGCATNRGAHFHDQLNMKIELSSPHNQINKFALHPSRTLVTQYCNNVALGSSGVHGLGY